VNKYDIAAAILELLFAAHLALVVLLVIGLCLVLWWLGVPAPPWVR
jgi:hypothetical protein